jgi:hypothetical protein
VLDIGSNSRAMNFPADKKCSHSYRAECAAGHENKKSSIGRTFGISHFFAFSASSDDAGRDCCELRSRARAIVSLMARARTEDLLRCIWCAISAKLKPERARPRSRSSASVDQREAFIFLPSALARPKRVSDINHPRPCSDLRLSGTVYRRAFLPNPF